jgi:dipeptidyl aminopeptidase/acylaminoacyl peptidase/uncharacterized Ntn-hydrolase superfamily protein
MKRLLGVGILLLLVQNSAWATWSIVAVDRNTGRMVISSSTCAATASPENLKQLQAVVIPGVGIAACQAGVDTTHKNHMLIFQEMQKGTSPDEIIRMLHDDPAIERRQFGIVDMKGRMSGHSGSGNGTVSIDVQGEVPGENIFYSVQGNSMARKDVITEAARVLRETPGSVTDRVMAAMEKAAELGGDRRCTCDTSPLAKAPCTGKVSHVAYILAADAKDPLGTHVGNAPDDKAEPWNDGKYALYITVTPETTLPTEDANPVKTLRMRYDAWKKAQTTIARHPITTDDWYRLNRVSDVQFAPNGKTIAFVMTRADREMQKNVSHVYVVAADGRSEPRMLVKGFPAESHPRWSPDGQEIAFTAAKNDGDRPQIYLMHISDSDAERVTNLENGVNDFVWSPDNRRFALISRTGKREDKNDPLAGITVVDHLHYAQDGRGLLKDQRSHVFVIDIATGATHQITDGDGFDDADAVWSPDGKWIAFVSDRTGKAFDGSHNTDVFIVSSAGGTPRKVSPQAEANGSPAFSPDGKSIAFTGVVKEGDQSDIYMMPFDGGPAVNLTEGFDERISRFVWTTGGIYFTTNMKGQVPLFKLDVAAKKVDPIPAQQGTQVTSFSFADDGSLAVTRSGFRHPPDVFVGAPGAAPNRHVTDVNRTLLSERALSAADELKYKAADGMDLQGWLVKPLAFDPAKKYPLVLRIHGGPSGMFNTGFDHEVQVLAARGYGVLFVNPRGSSGYGQTFVRANNKDWAGKDYTDIMKGVDTAISQNAWIDTQRLAVYGCSYGGYMTNWIITQTTRFSAAAPECAMSDMVTLWGTTDGANSPEEAFGGSPWETFDLWWGRSPLKFAQNVKTPTLIIHGEQDNRVPIAQAEQMFRALKRHGVEAEFVRYPGESHGEFVNGKPAHYVDRIERVLAWFDKHTGTER